MAIEIKDVPVLCPVHGVPLIHIPEPVAEDVVVCPFCGTGGPYKQVVEQGGNLMTEFVTPSQLPELLRKAGFTRK